MNQFEKESIEICCKALDEVEAMLDKKGVAAIESGKLAAITGVLRDIKEGKI